MSEEAIKKLADKNKKIAPFLSVSRIEMSPENVGFDEPCPCCGKRRCLEPSSSRKRRLFFKSEESEAAAAAAAAAASTPARSSPNLASNFSTPARSSPNLASNFSTPARSSPNLASNISIPARSSPNNRRWLPPVTPNLLFKSAAETSATAAAVTRSSPYPSAHYFPNSFRPFLESTSAHSFRPESTSLSARPTLPGPDRQPLLTSLSAPRHPLLERTASDGRLLEGVSPLLVSDPSVLGFRSVATPQSRILGFRSVATPQSRTRSSSERLEVASSSDPSEVHYVLKELVSKAINETLDPRVLKELVNQAINEKLVAAEGASNQELPVEEAGQEVPVVEEEAAAADGEGWLRIKCRCGVISEFLQIHR